MPSLQPPVNGLITTLSSTCSSTGANATCGVATVTTAGGVVLSTAAGTLAVTFATGEIAYCTISGTTLTLTTRGAEGTTATTHAVGESVALGDMTAAVLAGALAVGDIIVAGSDAPLSVKNATPFVCTGTITGSAGNYSGDEVVFRAAEAAITANRAIKAVGTFALAQIFFHRTANTKLDLDDAVFNFGSTWAPAGRFPIQVGPNHIASLGTVSWSSGQAPLFTNSGSGAGFLNSDSGYLMATITPPAGLDNYTRYYIVNATPTGFGAATCQLAATPGGTPIVTTSAGGGSFAGILVGYTASYSSSSNTITVLDSSAPILAAGTGIVFVEGSIGGVTLNSVVYYLSPTGSGSSYELFADPGLNDQVTITTTGGNAGFSQVVSNLKVSGGTFNYAAGLETFAVGIKTNLLAFNSLVSGQTHNWNGVNDAGTQTCISAAAIGGKIRDCVQFQGPQFVGISGAASAVEDCRIYGAFTGIGVGASAIGADISGNYITECVNQAITVAAGAVGTSILNNGCVRNCMNPANVPNAEIWDAGTGTQIESNSYVLLDGVGNVCTNGSGTQFTPIQTATGSFASKTTSQTLISYTPVSDGVKNTQTYRIQGYMNTTGYTVTGSVAVNLTYPDQKGVSQNDTISLMSSAGTIVASDSAVAGPFSFISKVISINSAADVPIVLSTVVTGTAEHDVPWSILERVG